MTQSGPSFAKESERIETAPVNSLTNFSRKKTAYIRLRGVPIPRTRRKSVTSLSPTLVPLVRRSSIIFYPRIHTTDAFNYSYTGDDPIGVELAGALKNVYAIAAGMADGLGFENNTRASR